MTDDLPNEGSILDGRYRLVRAHGRGATAQVYLAEHLYLGERNALKVTLTTKPALVARTLKEAGVLARIRHPGVVRPRDAGLLPDGRAFLATDWLEGLPLEDLWDSTTITVEQGLAVAERLLSALTAVHGAGVLHRDVQPKNIIVPTGPDGPGWAESVLIDFGYSFAQDGGEVSPLPRTDPACWSGTPGYMSPEQAMGRVQGVTSDIYGVGAVLFRLLFRGYPGMQRATTFYLPDVSVRLPIFLDRLENEVSIPDSPSSPSDVRGLLAALLQRDPTKRPQTATDALKRLRELHSVRNSTDLSLVHDAPGSPVAY